MMKLLRRQRIKSRFFPFGAPESFFNASEVLQQPASSNSASSGEADGSHYRFRLDYRHNAFAVAYRCCKFLKIFFRLHIAINMAYSGISNIGKRLKKHRNIYIIICGRFGCFRFVGSVCIKRRESGNDGQCKGRRAAGQRQRQIVICFHATIILYSEI